MFHTYRRPAEAGSFVVRLMKSGSEVVGFVREVQGPDDAEATFPSEQVPADEALELALGRSQSLGGGRVYVELEPDLAWDPAWGELAGEPH